MWVKPDPARWQGRVDSEEAGDARRWHQQIRCEVPSGQAGVALLGFACDAGVKRNHGRPGAHKGPQAIRHALANLAWHGGERVVWDAGDVVCEGDALEAAQAELAVMVDGLLTAGHFPVVMGGGHEVAFGTFSGLARHLANQGGTPKVGILNLDAHFDLRLAREANSGTPFRQIAESCVAHGWPFHYACFGVAEPANTAALFARARELDVTYRLDEDMGIAQLPDTLHQLSQFLAPLDHLYLTIDIDVLPAYQAPGVSAPAARGVALEVIEAILDLAKASDKLRIVDLAELNPEFDIDHRTAKTAARLIHRLTK
ncbi:formiminoglutamase [Chitinivorax tropicus]|uniref:Formimidoylglutamase n=1 Tax=Chitinivorax tropicus TaxID=714531 RepID=A0A840MWE7_9PROT|nr:formimidoylglutamase [Chitinivorax tropicus]MBB5019491.1 formiminoglutamase [Chitinivorax tropicus]